MEFLPLFHQVRGQTALVVGGGPVAARKAQLLLDAGARVRLLAPELSPATQALVDQALVVWECKHYESRQLDTVDIVVAATDDRTVNHQVAADARQARLPVNVVNDPDIGTFIFPAVIDRSPIVAAVSSSGAAPVLTRLMRGRIESLIPAGYGQLAELVGQYRKRVQATLTSPTARRRFWERILSGVVADRALTGQVEEAGRLLEKELSLFAQDSHGSGEVYLIGAGPGDPDLLTFKALRLMQQADVVLYDRLVSQQVLGLVRRDAELVYVGKRRADHAVPQEGINELLIRHARAGRRVCRLKGGDPFIFGRGGEEIEQLAAAGIDFQVVPGITAASGCAAYSGIPLTHRDYSQSVRFVTAHLKNNTSDLNWSELVAPGQTLVFYMGLVALPEITRQLCLHGCSPDMPIALVEQGTTPQHRVFTATLSTIGDLVAQHDVQAPTLIIVGDVVKLHHKLNWFRPAVEA